MRLKICGISDPETLKYLTTHPHPPEYIGFIVNYPKSRRFVEFHKLKKLLKINKKNSKYVAVLINPNEDILEKIKGLPFDYYQIYDCYAYKIKSIKEKYRKKIIVAITVKDQNDVTKFMEYNEFADIILFDSAGFEKSEGFDHSLLNKLEKKENKWMIAGNIKVHDLEIVSKIADYVDVSGSLETNNHKDIKKIKEFLLKVKKINDENSKR